MYKDLQNPTEKQTEDDSRKDYIVKELLNTLTGNGVAYEEIRDILCAVKNRIQLGALGSSRLFPELDD